MNLCQLFDRTFDLMLGVICLSEETLAVPDDPPVDSEPEPKLFKRPSGLLSRQINRFLPPGPSNQIELEFGNFHKELHALDYLRSAGMLAVFLGLMVFQVWLWRGFLWSPAVLAVYLFIWLGDGLVHLLGPRLATDIGEVGLVIFALLLAAVVLRFVGRRVVLFVLRRRQRKRAKRAPLQNDGEAATPSPAKPKRVSLLSSAAVSEEQWFREGAENWNKRQRFVSCAGFALVHLGNIIYPIATMLPLGLMGYVFMRSYLREYKTTGDRVKAVLRSSKLHRMYNRIALWATVIQLTTTFVFHISLYGH